MQAAPSLAVTCCCSIASTLSWHTIVPLLLQAKAEASLDSAWGQAFMELITMHEALVRRLDKVNVRNDKKRTAAEVCADSAQVWSQEDR